jgi:predicted dehydrogenase
VIRVAVVGYGYWGPNLARIISKAPGCKLAAVCDLLVRRLVQARRLHPGVHLTTDWPRLLADPRIDAVAVATPAATHFNRALAAMRAGKHVLVEKPLARTADEAQSLIEESERRSLVLMVDHTFVFSPSIQAIRELLTTGALGKPCYYDSVRLSLGRVRSDVNVLWDLAAHDLSIVDHLLSASPAGVLATGVALAPGEPEHMAYLTLLFPGAFMAHVHASWLSPVKTRRMVIGGSRGSVVYDDLEPIDKVKVYEHQVANGSGARDAVPHRLGEMWLPRLATREPLRAAVEHFADCIAGGRRPISDGAAGLRVVRLLEATTRSLEGGAQVVTVDAEGIVA